MKKIIMLGLLLALMVGRVYAEPANLADKHWRAPVSTAAALPTWGNQVGDVRLVQDTYYQYTWNGTVWQVSAAAGTDETVKYSAIDAAPGYLNTKIVAQDGLVTSMVPLGAGVLALGIDTVYDDSTVGINLSNELYVKDDGVTKLQINSDIAGDGLGQAVGGELIVNVDTTTIEVNLDILRVADGAITEPKLAMTNAAVVNKYIKWNGAGLEWFDPFSTFNSQSIQVPVNQTTHGFSVGDVLRWDSGTSYYVLAQADSSTNAEVAGIVSSVSGPDDFILFMAGMIDTLTVTAGNVYFLSATVPGQLTTVVPSTVGHVSKPLLLATASDGGVVVNFRGVSIGNPLALASPEYVVSSASGTLPNEKILTAGTDISVTPGVGITTIADTATLLTVTGRGADTPTTVQLQNALALQLGKSDVAMIAGQVRFWSAGASATNNFYTALTAGTQIANAAYTLPTGLPSGTSGYLSSTTGGVMSWVAGTSVGVTGNDTEVQFNNAGAMGADAGFTYLLGTDQLVLGEAGQSGSLKLFSENGGTDHFVLFTPSATQTMDTSYILPVDDGTNGQALVTNGSGLLTWTTVTTPPGGSDTYVQYNSGGSAFGAEATFNYTAGSDLLKVVNIEPNGGDNTGKLGDTNVRWADIYCVNIHTGDIKMMNDWVIKEDWDGPNGIILVSPEGKKFKFKMEEIQ